jgi:hypothetical protein
MSNDLKEDTKETLKTAKDLALKGIVPQCREIALNFFNCVENNLKALDKNGNPRSYQEMEEDLNKNVIPHCMKLHNLDECLRKYDNNYKNGNNANEDNKQI